MLSGRFQSVGADTVHEKSLSQTGACVELEEVWMLKSAKLW